MTPTIVVTPDVSEFITGNSTAFYENNGIKYSHMPFWFEHLGNNHYKIYSFDELPADLKKKILEIRAEKIYYYEDKPYRLLHEGKVKATSVLVKVLELLDSESISEERIKEANEELKAVNNNSAWIDVVVYEPLYECETKVCVKEKTDFYNNYKIKE